jgi:hypothetical protein
MMLSSRKEARNRTIGLNWELTKLRSSVLENEAPRYMGIATDGESVPGVHCILPAVAKIGPGSIEPRPASTPLEPNPHGQCAGIKPLRSASDSALSRVSIVPVGHRNPGISSRQRPKKKIPAPNTSFEKCSSGVLSRPASPTFTRSMNAVM